MDKEKLYINVKSKCTPALLKELSMKIIDAYKSGNRALLARIAGSIFPDRNPAIEKANRLFFTLIKHFHPDRYASIMKDVESAYANNDAESLEFFDKLFSASPFAVERSGKPVAWETEEEYAYDESDLGEAHEYDYSEIHDTEPDETDSETDAEFDFYSAVRSAMYGNLDFDVDPADLEFLAGELDLSDYSLRDLDGLQYCTRISVLNLSNNRIANVYALDGLSELRELYLADNEINDIDCLRGLSSLETLDVSGNDIEDVSVLLDLEHLLFVDLRGNPVKDRDSIAELEERGVVVIV